MKPQSPAVPARGLFTAILVGGSLLGIPLSAQQHNPTIALTAVRFWSLGDVTRVAIETSAEIEYHSERIEAPDRIFFDLIGVHRRAGVRGVQIIPVRDRLLEQIRIAETQPGVARIVLDLAVPVECTVSQLSTPDRLMIELRPAKAPAPPPAEMPPAPDLKPAVVTAASPAMKTTAPPPPVMAPPVKTGKAAPPVPVAAASPTAAEKAAGAALAAKRDSQGDRSLIRALGLKLERVVIDPGHGGHDNGTIGPAGLAEKDLVLDIARRLGTLVSQRLGSEVVYTRTDDTFVPLEARTEIANEHKADLFLSIHANSSRARSIAGSETYYLNFTSSADELDVASRENATSQKSIFELQDLVQKIARKEKAQESREFAAVMQKALQAGLWRGKVKDRGVKKAPFLVLIGASMPSVLAEVDFLSNPRQERLLKRGDHRQKIAEALYKGLSQYAAALSHFQVARNGAE